MQGGAGYPYGPPPTGTVPLSAAAMPVSSAPYPPPSPMLPQPTGTNFEELAAAVTTGGGAAVNFHGEDNMTVDAGASEAGAGGSGSRWPREETLALIGIRSEMDAAFRNAALKSPLWEEVSRKLAELGYRRSAKKCKEKFENVDKYYKRTKEGRAGRQDGKSYRFFSELEALHAAAPAPAPQQNQATDISAMATAACTSTAVTQDAQPLAVAPAVLAHPGAGGLLPDLSFSSDSGSESDDESDDEEEDHAGGGQEGSGELTAGGGEFDGRNKTVMALFEGMVKKITEKQEASQQLFLDKLEKWEADRTAREEEWRRQELARTNREREQLDRERAASAARDATLMTFLQRVGGNSPMPVQTAAHRLDASATSLQLVVAPPRKAEEGGRAGRGGESSGGLSRWPKEEVEALIQLRMEKDEHYQGMGTGAKGPLWEDISAGMRRIGYNRSSKRCKEKWENINKYFKKVKESRKRRPEDSKTCPYFHQLDAIYRKKQFAVTGGGGGTSSTASGNSTAAITASQQDNAWRELQGKISNDSDKRYIVEGAGSLHAPPPGNGEPSAATTVLDAIATNKKAEENMAMATEANVQSRQKELTSPDETDSDDIEGNYTDEGDDDGGNEDGKMKYMIEFQKSKESGSSNTPAPATAATVVPSSAPTSSTFLAVQ